LVDPDVSQDETYIPLEVTIAPWLIQLSQNWNIFAPFFFFFNLNYKSQSGTLQWHAKLARTGGLGHKLGQLTSDSH